MQPFFNLTTDVLLRQSLTDAYLGEDNLQSYERGVYDVFMYKQESVKSKSVHRAVGPPYESVQGLLHEIRSN